jgi:hypothetical protein
MFKIMGTAIVCLAVAGLLPSVALADSFDCDNITVNFTDDLTNLGDIPRVGDNDVFGLESSDSIDAYFGTTLSIAGMTGSQNAVITVEYIGKEATWVNGFEGGGTGSFSTDTNTLGNKIQWMQNSNGTIDFEFITNEGTATPDSASVANGFNPNDKDGLAGAMNFAIVKLESDWTIDNDDLTAGDNKILSALPDGTVLKAGLYILLDDFGGGNDDNHDDMVLRISARIGNNLQPVPEPGSLLLMGLGLTSLGAAVSRRRRKAGQDS